MAHWRAARHTLLLLFGCLVTMHCAAAQWRVVILLGADPTQPAAVEQVRALREIIAKAAPDGAEFYIDALDGLRFDGEALMPAFVDLMKRKYQRRTVDLVIGVAQPALDFTRRYHQEIWPGAPVLIASMDQRALKATGLPPDFAYLPLPVAPEATLDLIDSVQPHAKCLVIVSGSTPHDAYWADRMREIASRRASTRRDMRIEFWDGVPVEEIRARLAHEGQSTAVFFKTMYGDRNGRAYFPHEIVHLIAVVEDDAGMQRALRRLLHVGGYHTLCVGSAEELQAADTMNRVSCLVLDVQLPGASGPAFYSTLDTGRPPAVFITACDAAAVRLAIERAGGGELLPKPFCGKALLDAVARAITPGAHWSAPDAPTI